MYQTEVMIYLHANRLYHVLPLVSTKSFGMTSLVYNLINWLLVKIGITSFNISMYMPDTIMQNMSLQTTTDGIIRAFIVGGVFTIATICVSMILQNKRDI